ncbi:MAG: radical SAM protein, partial [Bacilli bacterium]|nr:radical SAM protein [Bacilli bacterium]
MIKVGLISLGCAKNLIDSEMILAMFDPAHFVVSNQMEGNDLLIVNTCAFIEAAKKESIQTIFECASTGAKVAVVGCLAERYEKELKSELKEADLIVPIHDYDELASYLKALTKEEGIHPMHPLKRVISTPDYAAYLRISEGCDNFCAFCAIPYIRGRFVSRPYEEILEEAKILKQKGVKEISIVSQDTANYGKDFPGKKPDFLDLLRALEEMDFYSIRLLYLYPDEISDELIQLIAQSKSIKHYFDIPIQCASDHLLKRMNRHGTKKDMELLFEK